jgi:DNA-binding transcriptional MerR regulator
LHRYSIKDLEHICGIKAHTLRIWEQRYNILEPKRTDTNIRWYDADDLKLILNISFLNNHGVKISKIAKLSPDELRTHVRTLAESSVTYPDQVQALTFAMIELDEIQFEKIISSNILRFGLEKTMVNIIFPFLSQIGILWQTDSINPAQEHFITHLIRQKLIVAIDAQQNNYAPGIKKFLLFTPEGELHEISLLFANYMVRSRGLRSIYLGQSLPINDVFTISDLHKPDFVFTIITSVPSNEDVEPYLKKLASGLPHGKVIVTGYQVTSQEIAPIDNMQIIKNMSEFTELLKMNQVD